MVLELEDQEGEFLVKLARKAVTENLRSRRIIGNPDGVDPCLLKPMGVFVTINTLKTGLKRLRGCIGFPYPTHPLVQAVIEAAIDAATGDPRFPPLSAKELSHVVFEVSILSEPKLIEVTSPQEYPSSIKVGVDGLIVEDGFSKGLLLPQVPVEWGWDEEEFLCQCCMKAGLPLDSWVLKGTKIYKFECTVFEETSPDGVVVRRRLQEE